MNSLYYSVKNIIRRKTKFYNKFDNELVETCYNGDIEKARLLIKNVDDINLVGHKFKNALLEAAFKGNKKGIMLHKKNIDNNIGYILEYTPLIAACQSGNISLVKLLIDNGADINKSGCVYEMSPLIVACVRGNKNIIDDLIDFNINESGVFYKVSPLTTACINDDVEIVNLLMTNKNVNLNKDEEFLTGSALAFACVKGYNDIVKYLIRKGANIHSNVHVLYDNALSIVTDRGNKNIERLLLESKARLSKEEFYGTPLEVARETKNVELINYLEKREKDALIKKQIM